MTTDGELQYYNNGMTTDGVTFVYLSSDRWNITSNTTRSISLSPVSGGGDTTLNLTANVTYTWQSSGSTGYSCVL